MSSFVWLAPLIFLVIIVAAALNKKQAGATGSVGFPYQPAKYLFTAAERSFLGVLDQAVGPEYRVFGKVRVADLASVKPGLSNSARQGALNRVAFKHFDFVVCKASDLSVICVIELNDKSHSSKRAQSRDDLLANICRTINLPLLNIPAKHAYSSQELRSQFFAAISPSSPELPVGT